MGQSSLCARRLCSGEDLTDAANRDGNLATLVYTAARTVDVSQMHGRLPQTAPKNVQCEMQTSGDQVAQGAGDLN
jgi:hypothetical protein